MNPVPLFPIPQKIDRPWGGSALTRWNRPPESPAPLGETWELGAFGSFDTAFADSPFASLKEACAYQQGQWLGLTGTDFPLLVKLIDARETLSVQVHPSVASGAAQPKNECWVILEAPANAFLYAGTTQLQDPATLVAKLNAGDLSGLAQLPVTTGDVIVIPAGTLHAITGGLVVAEIQQASDTTYRVHDWGRVGLDGKPRALHLTESVQCLDARPNLGLKPRPLAWADNRELLCVTPWFALERLTTAASPLHLAAAPHFRILQVLEGPTVLSWNNESRELARGSTVLLPAHLEVTLTGGQILSSWQPNWQRDIVAPLVAGGWTESDALALTAGTVASA